MNLLNIIWAANQDLNLGQVNQVVNAADAAINEALWKVRKDKSLGEQPAEHDPKLRVERTEDGKPYVTFELPNATQLRVSREHIALLQAGFRPEGDWVKADIRGWEYGQWVACIGDLENIQVSYAPGKASVGDQQAKYCWTMFFNSLRDFETWQKHTT